MIGRVTAILLFVHLVLASLAAAQPRAPGRVPRIHHGAAILPDGRVMVVGGENLDLLVRWGAGSQRALLDSSAIYDPRSGVWSPAGRLARPRTGLSAVAVAGGRVVALGGGTSAEPTTSADTLAPDVETWDPNTRRWRSTGRLITPRALHTATLLSDGRVLVAGGVDAQRTATSAVEIWDPSTSRSLAAAPLPIGLAEHAAVRLDDGRVLVAGGITGGLGGAASARAFVWDPARDRWTEVGPMSGARPNLSATLLADGRVLVVGNRADHRQTDCHPDHDPAACASEPVSGDVAEVYDPRTRRFSPTEATRQPRFGEHRAVRLADGRVAVFGMFEGTATSPRVVEVWSPSTGRWEDWGDADNAGPRGMSATLLPDGRVLLVGARLVPTPQGNRAASAFGVWSLATAQPVRPPRPSQVRRSQLE